MNQFLTSQGYGLQYTIRKINIHSILTLLETPTIPLINLNQFMYLHFYFKITELENSKLNLASCFKIKYVFIQLHPCVVSKLDSNDASCVDMIGLRKLSFAITYQLQPDLITKFFECVMNDVIFQD
jgi:hypothetical protein